MRKYPHAFQPIDIIDMINVVQGQLFRTIYRTKTAVTYDLLADNPFYPIDYSPQNIIDVVVNGREYPSKNIASSASPCYYYIMEENTIGIFPTPTEDVINGMTVFRYREPKKLTLNDLGVEPDFDRAWHMLIVYAVCKELAENALDTNMVSAFISQYNSAESDYNGSRYIEPFEIQEVY